MKCYFDDNESLVIEAESRAELMALHYFMQENEHNHQIPREKFLISYEIKSHQGE